ncbi:MAG: glycoside hydrolase family 3 C-terminal domain-containing protein, partial [Bacteroidota bacterium]|nr:glycoside hydrolase family 3 C-terminal domain-containing protein [Bacteroidota bacterium]
MKKTIAFIFAFLIFKGLSAQDFVSAKAKALVSKMTLEQKVNLVVGMGMRFPGARRNQNGPVVGHTENRVAGAAGYTYPIPQLGLPSVVTSDGPAGVRIDSVRKNAPGKTFYATAWPVATLLASTWDTNTVKRMGVAFGNEIHDYGIDVILGPALNIHRNPLGGRNFEYYSEDPLIAGDMTAALVNGIQSVGVGTSIKHFVANNQETNRNQVNEIISQRALREIYLRGFEIAVKKSQPWTVMSSYNKVNGTYTSEDHDLLTTILRKEWGFKGLVMTDWFGGKDPIAQMKAGNDLLMPGTPAQRKAILDAVKGGQLDEKVLDENAGRMVDLILKSPAYKKYKYNNKPDLKKDAQLSRSVADDGMVLLKDNNEALPITRKEQRVALFGNNGYELIAGGTGSGNVNKAYTISLFKGLTDAGKTLDPAVSDTYQDYLKEAHAKQPKRSFFEEFMHPTPPIPQYDATEDFINKAAGSDDIAVIAIGRNAGEGRDRKLEDDFNLSDTEQALIKNVCNAFHAQNKKVVVVLNIGGVIEVASWRDEPDAILLAWQPGLEGGHAIADLLDGKVNPSGKLATTFPMKYEDVPSASNWPGKDLPSEGTTNLFGQKVIPSEVTYAEGIYVGYRYYDTYHVTPAYEFGYGLSYTHFTYSDLKVSSHEFNKSISVTFTVKNSGKVAGKEVAELYLSAPKGSIDKPAEELKGFAKTILLQPGHSQKIRMELRPMALASFNTDASSWIADPGTYTVK